MRVAFFPSYLGSPRTGHGTYQLSLLEALLGQTRHQIVVVAHRDEPIPPVPPPHQVVRFGDVTARIGGHRATTLAMKWKAASAVREARVDVLIANGNWTIPRLPEVPRIVVVYEALFTTNEWGMYPPRFVRSIARITPKAIRGAAAVVAISETTADGVRQVDPACRVVLSPPAVLPFPPAPDSAPRADPYVLSIGWFHARKDLPLALRAWREAVEAGLDHDLVLAGDPGPYDPLHGSVGRRILDNVGAELSARVDFLGSVSRARLGGLLRGAAALMVTSHQEGFGIPVIEAFSVGTPVVAVRRGALPDAAGPMGLVVEPTPAAVSRGLAQVIGAPPDPAELMRYANSYTAQAQGLPILTLLDEMESTR